VTGCPLSEERVYRRAWPTALTLSRGKNAAMP
jgi:hypothetical protein